MIVRIARVKVGHCQAIIKKAPVERLGLFAFRWTNRYFWVEFVF